MQLDALILLVAGAIVAVPTIAYVALLGWRALYAAPTPTNDDAQ